MFNDGNYVTIQKTGKKWKALGLIGIVLVLGGLFVAHDGGAVLCGIAAIVIARIGRWWNHA